ncbi:hypothetical protein AABD41_01235 [Staphylococcus pseudoxylosus]|uniref:hypothetical protein n=1 Tax=Staphylococcus pseudoxylosus TaxID=2282419 RepID=UPI00398ABF22
MKNFLLILVTLILIGLLGTAIYIYNNPKVVDKITHQDSKDKDSKDSTNDVKEANDSQENQSNEYNNSKFQNDTSNDKYSHSHNELGAMAMRGENVDGMVDGHGCQWYVGADGTAGFTDQNGEDHVVVKGSSSSKQDDPSESDLPLSSGGSSKQQIEFNEKIAKEEKAEKKNNSSNQEQVPQQAQQQEQQQMSVQKTQQNVQAQQNVTADNSPKTVIEKQPVDKE